jgi:DNA replication licensing factor MCM3
MACSLAFPLDLCITLRSSDTIAVLCCFSLLNNAFEEQLAFQRALKEFVDSVDPTYAKDNEELFVAFEGSFGNKHVTPRTLMSRFLGNLVCIEGIVTKCKWLVLHIDLLHVFVFCYVL